MAFFNSPSGYCSEPCDSHSGLCHPCQNIEKHGNEEYFVCEECAESTHDYIVTRRPNLLKSPFLPLCRQCTFHAWTEHPQLFPFNGCRCPFPNPTSAEQKEKIANGHGKWLCAGCRSEELQLMQWRVALDDETRRGPVQVQVENGTPTTLILGRLCSCLRHLGGNGSEPLVWCAWRCGACFNYKHEGSAPLAQLNNITANLNAQNNDINQMYIP